MRPTGCAWYGRARALTGLLGLASALSACAPEWENSRRVYVRNRTGAEVRLSWHLACAPRPCGPWPAQGYEADVVEPEATFRPRLVPRGRDTLWAGWRDTVRAHVAPIPGDSVAVTVRLAAGTRFLVAERNEAYRHAPTDGTRVFDFALVPGTARWVDAAGHVHRRRLHPRRWRARQDEEAAQQQSRSYSLERDIDLY
ncbi:hypothetical protein [Hymenobacter arizonensis]|uniref:Uncharacterized protein n=1 Tax=Hymenobacter arizonensis TaxID=1227077 RepID=A0A1I6BNT9_HYMAR|nr:hypothetical protein [Hymenobacter arizonensis]SFQ82517.1 hypothetical protein SAMN04515668_4829 [Hymenobacter arizonensis]